ncbi:MAG: ribbon-helix-helix domain-containing protein [Candidatus Altiarchaeota archaeon]
MDDVRVNVLLPTKLLAEGQSLVKQGYFSNFSEVLREGLRKEIIAYKMGLGLTENDFRLMELIKESDAAGRLLTEKDMEKHGLKL